MTIRFICDVGSNHNGDLARAMRLIDEAKAIGCDAVKFQFFEADRLYAPGFLAADKMDELRRSELPKTWLGELAAACHSRDMEFHCTPFHVEAVADLLPFVDAYKIASYSILDLKLIEAVAKTLKPMSISLGNCVEDEEREAFRTARMLNHRVSVYHCSAQYPAPPEHCGLRAIPRKAERYGTVGWSDHTCEPAVIYYAVALGAKMIEFHLDLDDGFGKEYVYGHCWLSANMETVIDSVKRNESSLTEIIYLRDEEMKNRNDPDDEMRPLKKYRQITA